MLFSFCLDQFLQDLIKQADAVLVRLGLYVVVVTNSFSVQEVIGNPSPCATIRNHSVRSGKSKKENTSADIWPIRYILCIVVSAERVFSCNVAWIWFSHFFTSIFSITAPVLDNEKILHRLLGILSFHHLHRFFCAVNHAGGNNNRSIRFGRHLKHDLRQNPF